MPAWHASHPDHGVARRLVSRPLWGSAAPGLRDIFLTTLLETPGAIFRYLGPVFASTEGHVVVRVQPGGAAYRVIVLDDRDAARRVISVHGPYATP